MMSEVADYVVVGGGIVGLATAMTLGRRFPDARIVLMEKESDTAMHQTGRNSGVIHSGIYYKPGSFKARFARAGAESMVAFCRAHNIPHEVCGKVIVATCDSELKRLSDLLERGRQNGLRVEKVTAGEIAEVEPHVRCLGGIKVAATGITDYRAVCRKYMELFLERGGTVLFNCEVRAFKRNSGQLTIETSSGEYHTRFVINCAGLHSDRVAKAGKGGSEARIIPFRGEYYELVPEKRDLVKTLIYPVPNPDFPFLGVHFTRMIDGSVHAGPNAVLAFKREGYQRTDFNLRDVVDIVSFGGFWRFAAGNLNEGLKEMWRSLSKAAFVRSLQQLIPSVEARDLIPCKAGVRAQAMMADGKLVDDFLFSEGADFLHVCNAPSPAATASLEIANTIVDKVPNLK